MLGGQQTETKKWRKGIEKDVHAMSCIDMMLLVRNTPENMNTICCREQNRVGEVSSNSI